jgi:hypothetical protein
MGSAGVALQTGANAAFWNPGALPLQEPTAAALWAQTGWASGLRLNSLSGAARVSGVGVGLHLERLKLSVDSRTVFRPEGDSASVDADDRMGILAVGLDVAPFVRRSWPAFPRGMSWGIGLGLRSIQSEFAQYEASSNDLDAGTLLVMPVLSGPDGSGAPLGLTDLSFQAGWAIRNLTDGHMIYIEEKVKVGRRDRAGVALRASAHPHPRLGPLLRGAVSYERQKLLVASYEGEKPVDRLGAEVVLAGVLFLRGGRQWPPHFGDYGAWTWGVGLGLEPGSKVSPGFGGRIDLAREESDAFEPETDWALSAWVEF